MDNPAADPEKPLEVLRTIHSFDPCLACASHTLDPEGRQIARVQERVRVLAWAAQGEDPLGPYVIRTLESAFAFADEEVALVDVGTPGQVRVYRLDEVLRAPAGPRLGPHDPGLREALMALAGRPLGELLLIGVVPEATALGPRMSPAVRVAVGDRSAVEPSLLRHAFEAITTEGQDGGCVLQIDWVRARQTCADCGEVRRRAEGSWLRLCPGCGLPLRVEGGDELDLLEVSYEPSLPTREAEPCPTLKSVEES